MQNVTMQPSLDALQAQQAAGQSADVSAFANQNISLEATPAADTLEISAQEQPKKKGGLGKLLLGAAAAGAIGFGIYKLITGRGGSPSKLIKDAQCMADDAKKLVDGIDDKVVKEVQDKGTTLIKQADDDIVKVLQGKGTEFFDDADKLKTYIDDAGNGFKSLAKDKDGNIVYEFAKTLGEGDKAVEHIYSGTISKGFTGFDVSDNVDDILAIAKKGDKGFVLESVASAKDDICCNFTPDGVLDVFGKGITKENGKIAKIANMAGVEKVDDKYQAVSISKNFDILDEDALGDKFCVLDDGKPVMYADYTKLDKETDEALNTFVLANEKLGVTDSTATVKGVKFELKDDKWVKIKPETK